MIEKCSGCGIEWKKIGQICPVCYAPPEKLRSLTMCNLLNCVRRSFHCDNQDGLCHDYQEDLYTQWFDKNQNKAMHERANSKEDYWREGFRVGVEDAIDEIRARMTVDDQEKMEKAIEYLKRQVEYHDKTTFYGFK